MTWIAVLFLAWIIFEYIFIGSSRSIPVEKHIVIHQSEFNANKAVIIQKQSIPLLLIAKNKFNGLKQNRMYLALGEEGCVVLPINSNELKESCSEARYDLQGESLSEYKKPLLTLQYHYNKSTQNYSVTLNSDLYQR